MISMTHNLSLILNDSYSVTNNKRIHRNRNLSLGFLKEAQFLLKCCFVLWCY